MIMGFSVSNAKILVIDNVTKLDRSKFVKQFKIIGALSSARIVLITSIIFWDTPIMFVVELPKKKTNKNVAWKIQKSRQEKHRQLLFVRPLFCLQNGNCSRGIRFGWCHLHTTFDHKQAMVFSEHSDCIFAECLTNVQLFWE